MAGHRLGAILLAAAVATLLSGPAAAQLDETRERNRLRMERDAIEAERNRALIERGRIESDRLRDEGIRRHESLRPMGSESTQRNRDPRQSIDPKRPEAQQQEADRLKREEERLRQKEQELYFEEMRRR